MEHPPENHPPTLNYSTPEPKSTKRKGCLLTFAIALGIILLLYGLCITALTNMH
jgi:hypothetical protein